MSPHNIKIKGTLSSFFLPSNERTPTHTTNHTTHNQPHTPHNKVVSLVDHQQKCLTRHYLTHNQKQINPDFLK